MNQLKYQIFVSSTYKDLKDERDAVIKSILEIGHIPVGMEMFSAGDEEQWQLIQRTIDDCDYYLVIIGGKYGSMDGEISYTEKEYDYAKSKGIPTLGFVLDYDDNIPAKKIESDSLKIQKLEEFKKKVQGKIVNYWKNKDELTARVLAALTKQFIINPRVGWVRGDSQNSNEVLKELARLSEENNNLRLKLKDKVQSSKNDKLADLYKSLSINKCELHFLYIGTSSWSDPIEINYNTIFYNLSTYLIQDCSEDQIAKIIAAFFNPEKNRKLRSDTYPIPYHTVTKIMMQFTLSNLVEPVKSRLSTKDKEKYWKLTEFGITFYDLLQNISKDVLSPKKNNSKTKKASSSSE